MLHMFRSRKHPASYNDAVGVVRMANADGDTRHRVACKTVVLSFVVLIVVGVVVKNGNREGQIRSISDEEFENKLLNLFHDGYWLFPVKEENSRSYHLENVTLSDMIRHLERISDCNKISGIQSKTFFVPENPAIPAKDTSDSFKYLNSGWTKMVYSFKGSDGEPVAVKTLNPEGEDVHACFKDAMNKLSVYHLEKNGIGYREIDFTLPEWKGNGFKMTDSEQTREPSLNSRDGMILEVCRNRAKLKLLKEAYLMNILQYEHIVRLQDVCLSWDGRGQYVGTGSEISSEDGLENKIENVEKVLAGNDDGDDDNRGKMDLKSLSKLSISYSTQLGTDADLISLLQLSWEDRLRICHGVAKLIRYFTRENNPFDVSVLINDFRRQQFVIVNGDVMMTDLDDLTFEEKSCHVDDECHIGDNLWSPTVQCLEGVCRNWHNARNTLSAATHFISVLLPHGAPGSLKPLASEIVRKFLLVTHPTDENLALIENLVGDFSSGVYLSRVRDGIGGLGSKISHYKVMEGHDLPGFYDYRCRYTRGAYGCTVSVHDEEEAQSLCDFDDTCQAFVMSPVKSWTGRRYAHLKSNVTASAVRRALKGYALYYKSHIVINGI